MEQLVLNGDGASARTVAARTAAAATGGGNFGGKAAPAPPEMLNFQRASCALDASVKIYSARVDDVYSSSFRVLERYVQSSCMVASRHRRPKPNLMCSLSRNDGGAKRAADAGAQPDGEEGQAEEEAEGEAAAGRPRRAGRGKAGAAAASSTSCGGPAGAASITLGRLDSGFDVDPLFHKAARELDAGGTAGMLLHRLGVRAGGAIAFDSTDNANADADDSVDAGWAAAAAAAGGDTAALQASLVGGLREAGPPRHPRLLLLPRRLTHRPGAPPAALDSFPCLWSRLCCKRRRRHWLAQP